MFLIAILMHLLNEAEEEVASTALIVTLMNCLVIGFAPLFAMSIVASNKIGDLQEAEKNKEPEEVITEKKLAISQINKAGLGIATAITPIAAATLFFSEIIFTNVFQQEETVAKNAQLFLRTYSAAVPGLMARVVPE